jgi:hypothetical protein
VNRGQDIYSLPTPSRTGRRQPRASGVLPGDTVEPWFYASRRMGTSVALMHRRRFFSRDTNLPAAQSLQLRAAGGFLRRSSRRPFTRIAIRVRGVLFPIGRRSSHATTLPAARPGATSTLQEHPYGLCQAGRSPGARVHHIAFPVTSSVVPLPSGTLLQRDKEGAIWLRCE